MRGGHLDGAASGTGKGDNMYSMVMVVAMAGAPEVPQFGMKGGNGCVGGFAGFSGGCVGGHGGGKFGFGGGHGKFGFGGGCGGKFGGGFGDKCGLFSCFKGKGNGCVGGYAAPAYAAPAPGCGQTIIPPAPGTYVPGPGGVYQPGTIYQPGTVIQPGVAYPPGTIVTPGTVVQPGTTVVPGTTTTAPKKAMPRVDPKPSDPKKLGPAPRKDDN